MACFRNNEDRNALRTWTGIFMQGVSGFTLFVWIIGTDCLFIAVATTYGYQLHLLLRHSTFFYTLRSFQIQRTHKFVNKQTFFQSAGISNPFIITIIADVVNTVMTIIGVQLIDRVGRRRLLLIGAAGMCISEFIVAIVGVTAGHPGGSNGVAVNITAQRVLIAFTCIYIAFFATSWGPVIWVLTGELFVRRFLVIYFFLVALMILIFLQPLGIRAKSMSLAVASNWLWNFGIGYATPYLVNATTFGPAGIKAANLGVKVFFIWGSTCVGCFVFTYFFIPETKGLSLEQIDLLYKNSTSTCSCPCSWCTEDLMKLFIIKKQSLARTNTVNKSLMKTRRLRITSKGRRRLSNTILRRVRKGRLCPRMIVLSMF